MTVAEENVCSQRAASGLFIYLFYLNLSCCERTFIFRAKSTYRAGQDGE